MSNEQSRPVSALERLQQMQREMEEKEAKKNNGGGGGYTKVFHNWKPGANTTRLVGDFIQVKTHYIAPEKLKIPLIKSNACSSDNKDKLPKVVNCPNWDSERGEFIKNGKCPLCALNRIAYQTLKDKVKLGLSEKEIKDLEAIKSATSARSSLKWAIIDRDDPFVTKVEGDTETKIPGFKVASITSDIQKGITAIGGQLGDITDPNTGVDIVVTQSKVNNKITYSVVAAFDKATKGAKITPLTAEERAMKLPDMKAICCKATDPELLRNAMTDDYKRIVDDNQPQESSAPSKAESSDEGDEDIPF